MNCQRLQRVFQENLNALLVKYEGHVSSREDLAKLLIENTNFVMSEMFKECLAISRESQT